MDTPAYGRVKTIVGLVLGVLYFLVVLLINLLPFYDGKNDLLDFGSFYNSGLMLAKDRNPYDANSRYVFEIVFPRVGAGGKMVNLNPPVSLLFFRPLAQTDPYRAMIVWQVCSLILYIISVLLLANTYKDSVSPAKFVWAFLLAGFWHTIVLGQVYAVLLLFTVLGWILLRQSTYVWGGIALGVMIALKPNFVVWALFLLAAGYVTSFLVSLVTAAVISLLPVFVYGWNVYAQWLAASALRRETLIMPGNNSLPGLFARFDLVSFGIAISILVTLALIAYSRWREPQTMSKIEYASSIGILTSLLASPIAWTGYTILLLPIFFSIKRWTMPVVLSAAILTIPFQIVLQLFQTSFFNFVVFGWLYGWAMLSVLFVVVRNTMTIRSIQTN